MFLPVHEIPFPSKPGRQVQVPFMQVAFSLQPARRQGSLPGTNTKIKFLTERTLTVNLILIFTVYALQKNDRKVILRLTVQDCFRYPV